MKQLLIISLIAIFSTSCVVVKEYEKVNINDPDMKLSTRTIDKVETRFQVYREAASGANGGKTGGGCGCN
ncbi:MAG: DUF4266 domain-containing protein [Oceanihabitans sp.]